MWVIAKDVTIIPDLIMYPLGTTLLLWSGNSSHIKLIIIIIAITGMSLLEWGLLLKILLLVIAHAELTWCDSNSIISNFMSFTITDMNAWNSGTIQTWFNSNIELWGEALTNDADTLSHYPTIVARVLCTFTSGELAVPQNDRTTSSVKCRSLPERYSRSKDTTLIYQ